MDFVPLPPNRRARRAWRAPISLVMPPPERSENGRAVLVFLLRVGLLTSPSVWLRRKMFATAQKTQELWMWKMEYLHHEQRPLYFGEWF